MKTRTGNAVMPVHKSELLLLKKDTVEMEKAQGKAIRERGRNQVHGTVKGAAEQISTSLFEKETTEG